MGKVLSIEDHKKKQIQIEHEKSLKEYEEFVKLLKYFVDTQPSKYQEIHVSKTNKGYKVLDENNKAVVMSDYLENFEDDSVKLDDILVSILITNAPKKIVLHNINENNETISLIKRVFKNVINQ